MDGEEEEIVHNVYNTQGYPTTSAVHIALPWESELEVTTTQMPPEGDWPILEGDTISFPPKKMGQLEQGGGANQMSHISEGPSTLADSASPNPTLVGREGQQSNLTQFKNWLEKVKSQELYLKNIFLVIC